MNKKCSIELIFRSFVTNNVTNLRIFDDDQHILAFLTNKETFKDVVIDDEEHQANLQNGNLIPKGVRTLEGMFDLNKKILKASERQNT